MSKRKIKQRLILVFLGFCIIRILPDWIDREGYRNGMAWVWLLVFIIPLLFHAHTAMIENRNIKEIREMQKRLRKGVEKRFKGNAGLNVKDKFP